MSPKKWGGLGEKDLRIFKKALLGKRIWSFEFKKNAKWRGVLAEKYEIVEGWWEEYKYHDSVWVRFVEEHMKGWREFSGLIFFGVGDESMISFFAGPESVDRVSQRELFPTYTESRVRKR